jgi:hypothetical protein
MPDTAWTLSTQYPVVLLPVRLETRFTATQLLVRVYPDEIHVDSHEPPLTVDEIEWGKRYWTAVWNARGADAGERAAWEELATRYGPERASWVARVLEPTNPQDRPAGTPSWPPLGTPRDAAWTQRAVARAMPTRWHLTGYPIVSDIGPIHVVGGEVPRPLPVGPAPSALSTLDPAQPPVDDATRWLVDFTEAEKVGMGLRLPRYPIAGGPAGYWRLVVHGVVENATAETTAGELSALLEAQFHTRGLGFVAPGAPTNNTATATSVYSRRDPAYRDSLRVRHGDAVPPATYAGARLLANALGVPLTSSNGVWAPRSGTPAALGRARGGARTDDTVVRDLTTALWGATAGYALHQLTAGRFTDQDIRGLREHFRSYVRPGGPLPMLRIGDQPYGVLPVLPLDRWADLEHSGLNPTAVWFMRRLRDLVWRPAAGDPLAVPRIVRGAQSDETVARILAMSPTARRVYGRSALGTDYVTALWRFGTVALSEQWRTELAAAGAELAQRFALNDAGLRINKLVYARESYPLDAPWVLPAQGLPGDYLVRLGNASRTAESLRDAPDYGTAGTTPLLYRLLRHSLLAEFGIAAGRVRGDGVLEPELIDVDNRTLTPTLWRRLAEPVPGGSTPLGAWMRAGGVNDPRVTDLTEASTAARALAAVGPADLERVFAQHLDATSHRLDAWITSLATRRLGWLRRPAAQGGKPSGAHLGGYGWVTDVVPREREPKQVTSLPPLETGPLVEAAADTAGPVHSPSPTHAVTAAVLRAAQRAHGDRAGSPLAVDLTSGRARAAAWVLDGVRQGQPLGALLGARLERWIQEHPLPALASWIDRLRELAPLRAASLDLDGTPTETIAARNVVDGLAVHRRRLAGRLDPVRDIGVPAGSSDVAALNSVFDRLHDLVDAIADALLVEGVHQAVQGNPLRAGATVDAMSTGEAPPPELESLRTPRTGDAVTHRVAVLLDTIGPSPAAWPMDSNTETRGVAEPALNGWAARLLPSPRTVPADAVLDDGTRVPIDLAAMTLSPLDWMALTPQDPLADLTGTDLEAYLLYGAARAVSDSAGRRVVAVDCAGLPAFLEAARAARDLMRSARPLRPADLTLPEHADAPPGPPPPAPPLSPMPERVLNVLATVDRAIEQLSGSFLPSLRDGLVTANLLGIPGVVPPPPAPGDTDRGVLSALAATALPELQRRRAAATAATGATPDEVAVAKLTALVGDVPFLVPFTLLPVTAAAFTGSLAASTALQGGDPHAASTRLLGIARVRSGVDRLVTSLGYAEALDAGDALNASVAQLPYNAGDRWAGLPAAAGGSPGNRLAFTLHFGKGGTPQVSGWVCGLLVEEWTEVVPRSTEITGVAVHAESPDAVPPQAVLLAVPPDSRATWDPDLLTETVAEALELAQLRAVDLEALHPADPDALTDIGQLFPASVLATNTVVADAASTDFTRGLPR